MYWVWMIIVSLIAGIIGPLARLVLPGKQQHRLVLDQSWRRHRASSSALV